MLVQVGQPAVCRHHAAGLRGVAAHVASKRGADQAPQPSDHVWTGMKAGVVLRCDYVFLVFGVHPFLLVFCPCGCAAWFALCSLRFLETYG